jgi:hypothetical protein
MNSRSPISPLPGSCRSTAVTLSLLCVVAHGICPLALHAQTLFATSTVPAATKAALSVGYGKLPLSFEANQGQTDSHVKFLSRGNGYALFLTDKAAVLELSKGDQPKADKPKAASHVNKIEVIRMELAGASQSAHVTGTEQLPGTANYFVGNDASKWHTDVPTYAKVKYTGVYPGVDLVYYGNQSQLEYDFVVAPKADPKAVQLHFAGAEKLKLAANGDLILAAKDGEIAFHKPVVYQALNGQRQPVEGSFALLANNTVGFKLGSYDHSRELVIDPTLAYSTYLGLRNVNTPNAITVDSAGDAYIVGSTTSTDFPVTGSAIQKVNAGQTDAFITKLNPQGTALIYSTYLGGSLVDSAYAVAVDTAGEAFVAGSSGSVDFPVTSNAFQKVNNDYADDPVLTNAFVAKLTSNGASLIYSTYLGGSFGPYSVSSLPIGDIAYGIAIDVHGNAYVTGQTGTFDFPVTAGAFQTVNNAGPSLSNNYPSTNAFVTKLNPTGSGLIYSTYFGGTADYGDQGPGDVGYAIAIDAAGDAYITGQTASPENFLPTTPNALQRFNNVYPGQLIAFVTEFNPEGSALIYSTYLGGGGYRERGDDCCTGDVATGIAINTAGNAYVTGRAVSIDFPTAGNAFQKANNAPYGGLNAFVTKLNTTGTALVYSTYLGGSSYFDGAAAIALDSTGDATVAGRSYSSDFPLTSNALQTVNPGPYSAFLSKLNAEGSGLIYSSYFGSRGSVHDVNKNTQANALALDKAGNVYIVGSTSSNDLPITSGAFETTNPSASNGFVAKFSFDTIDFSQGFASAEGPMRFNGSTGLDGKYLRLTDGDRFEAASAFYTTPVNVQSFSTDFNFKLDLPAADGITFTLQGVGPGALGANGGGLGYAGIGKSVAVKFDIHNNAGEGVNSTGLYQDGASPTVPAINLTGTGIDLHNRCVFHVHLSYDGTTLSMRLSDPVTHAAFTKSFTVDIPAIVGGSTAYVGFTGGTGAETATQEIQDWIFVNP